MSKFSTTVRTVYVDLDVHKGSDRHRRGRCRPRGRGSAFGQRRRRVGRVGHGAGTLIGRGAPLQDQVHAGQCAHFGLRNGTPDEALSLQFVNESPHKPRVDLASLGNTDRNFLHRRPAFEDASTRNRSQAGMRNVLSAEVASAFPVLTNSTELPMDWVRTRLACFSAFVKSAQPPLSNIAMRMPGPSTSGNAAIGEVCPTR